MPRAVRQAVRELQEEAATPPGDDLDGCEAELHQVEAELARYV